MSTADKVTPSIAADGVSAETEPPTLVRSQEQLQVRVRAAAVRRLRVRKRVVTEEVTHTVTVRREELVVEDEPLDPAIAAGPAELGEGPHLEDRDLTIVLHEERVEVRTVVVPVEQVTVRVRRVDGSTTVTDTVRGEHVDLDQPDQPGQKERA